MLVEGPVADVSYNAEGGIDSQTLLQSISCPWVEKAKLPGKLRVDENAEAGSTILGTKVVILYRTRVVPCQKYHRIGHNQSISPSAHVKC